jgi:hypothetical protein
MFRLSDYVNSPEIKAMGPGFGRTALSAIPGATDDFFNVMMQGRKKLEEDYAKALPIRPEDVAAAKEYQDATARLEVSFERLATRTFPALADLADYISDHILGVMEGAHTMLGVPLGPHETHAQEYLRTHPDEARQQDQEMEEYNARRRALGRAPISATEQEKFIREKASALGIDPNVAAQVARSEGLYGYVGDAGSSFGPFQLHYGGIAPGMMQPGLGDKFTSQTGLDARDPRTWQAQVQFALEYAKANGWGPWNGWRGSPWAGISPGVVPQGPTFEERWGAAPGAGAAARGSINNSTQTNQHQSSNTEVTVGQVTIVTQAKDSDGIFRDAASGLRKNLAVAMNQNYSSQG